MEDDTLSGPASASEPASGTQGIKLPRLRELIEYLVQHEPPGADKMIGGGFIGCHRMIEVAVEMQEAGMPVPGCVMMDVEIPSMNRAFRFLCSHAVAMSTTTCPLTIQ